MSFDLENAKILSPTATTKIASCSWKNFIFHEYGNIFHF